MATWTDPSPDPQADLEKLAAELDGGEYAVTLVGSPGRRPHLHITNRAAAQLTENIYCDGAWFWWSWAERIARATDLAGAAAAIDRVLWAIGDRQH